MFGLALLSNNLQGVTSAKNEHAWDISTTLYFYKK